MIEEYEDLNLETDHLEEVIEIPAAGPAGGCDPVPHRAAFPGTWCVPLLVLVPLGAVASITASPRVPRAALDRPSRRTYRPGRRGERPSRSRSPTCRPTPLSQALPPASMLILALPWR